MKTIQGKALEVNTIKEALNESYKKRGKPKKEIDGFVLNETLSDNEAQVYWNPISQNAMVVHRGTASIGDVSWTTRSICTKEGVSPSIVDENSLCYLKKEWKLSSAPSFT